MQTVLTLIALVSIWAAARILYLQGKKIMSALDDIKTAANRLIADVQAIAAKLTNVAPDDSAALETLAGQLNSAADAADAALNPPAPPTA